MLERRRRLRRAVSGGAVLGAAGGFFLACVEIMWVTRLAREAASGAGLARFAVSAAALLMLLGTVVGALAGVLRYAVAQLGERLSRRRSTAAIWRARLYALLATPAIALVCALAFRGRR